MRRGSTMDVPQHSFASQVGSAFAETENGGPACRRTGARGTIIAVWRRAAPNRPGSTERDRESELEKGDARLDDGTYGPTTKSRPLSGRFRKFVDVWRVAGRGCARPPRRHVPGRTCRAGGGHRRVRTPPNAA